MAVAFRSVPRQVEPGLPPTAYHRSRVRESRPFLRRSGMSVPTRNRSLDSPPSHVAPVVTAVGPTRWAPRKPGSSQFPVARHESLFKFVGREDPVTPRSPRPAPPRRKLAPDGKSCQLGFSSEVPEGDVSSLATPGNRSGSKTAVLCQNKMRWPCEDSWRKPQGEACPAHLVFTPRQVKRRRPDTTPAPGDQPADLRRFSRSRTRNGVFV